VVEKNELKPWRVKTWCIGTASAKYVAKMEDVLDVYHRSYTPRYPVVGVDEVSKELHDTPRGTLPLEPGQEARRDYEYARQGVCNLFLAVEPLRGWRKVRVTDRRTAGDFAEFIRGLVDEDYPDADKVVLVVDNLNTHHPACLYERFEPAEAHRIASRLEWHYTPEHGSWLNVAECELSALSRQCLARRIPDRETLIREAAAWEKRRNTAQVRIDWQFTTQDARIKLKRLYPVVKEHNSD
jgi:transposase